MDGPASTVVQSSGSGGLRSDFVRARDRLSSTRRRRTARLGLVATRFGGSGRSASRSCSPSRCLAIWRFRHWERVSSTATTITELSPILLRSRRLVSPSNARDEATSKRSSERVEDRLACWPPGPPAGENVQCSSSAGIEIASLILRSSITEPYRGHTRKWPRYRVDMGRRIRGSCARTTKHSSERCSHPKTG